MEGDGRNRTRLTPRSFLPDVQFDVPVWLQTYLIEAKRQLEALYVDPDAPGIPLNLVATAVTAGTKLTWTAAQKANSHTIYLSSTSTFADAVPIQVLDKKVLEYVDVRGRNTGATTLYYWVRGMSAGKVEGPLSLMATIGELANQTDILTLSSTEPRLKFYETDAASNEKLWDFDLTAKTFKLRTRTDADGAGVDIMTVLRGTGTAVSSVTFPSTTNANHFVIDRAAFAGTGAFGIGSVAQGSGYITLSPPARTAGVDLSYYLLANDNSGAVTIPAGSSAPRVAGYIFNEPNIINGGGAVIDDAYTVIIGTAPTEGTRNGALWVAAGASRFDDYLETTEITAPSAPPANGVRIYAVDNGAGKTQLMALFSSGTAQQFAIQP